jgi:uncharacterized membrane protein
MVEQLANSFVLIFVLMLVILILAGFLAFYLRVAGFMVVEVILLVVFPLLSFFSALPIVGTAISGYAGSITGKVLATAKVFDIPILRLSRIVIGINAVGFFIPTLITLNMLIYRRVPWRKLCILAGIISGVTYLYTFIQPEMGVVIYLFAIPPILAAGISFMFRRMKGSENLNTALMSYAGATIGVLVGADLLNLHKLAFYDWGKPMLVSIGGGSIIDALFLAGIVALFADFLFRSQEENILGRLIEAFRQVLSR